VAAPRAEPVITAGQVRLPLVAQRAAVEDEPDARFGLLGVAGRPVDHEQPADLELDRELLAEFPGACGVRASPCSTAPPGISHVDL
jgi:hypothetical protein